MTHLGMHDLKSEKGTFFEMSTDKGVMSDSVLTGGVSHMICCKQHTLQIWSVYVSAKSF